ncbi:MAG: hypothetical protein ABI442_05005 [Gemmatimonadaceae bacterium]
MRVLSIVASAALALGLAACSDSNSNDVSTPSISPAAGTYALVSIDAKPLPWTNPDSPSNTLISAAFDINADGSFDDHIAYSDGRVGVDHGTVVVSGSTATFTLANGSTFTATISGGIMNLSFAGHAGVLQSF